MNFFEYQESARRHTKWLILLFAAAVISLIVLTYLLFLVVSQYTNVSANAMGYDFLRFDWKIFLSISGIVITLILLGSLYRISSLSKGGASIAELMDAELLMDSGGDFKRRRLLNVVEEMAIASGTPVPSVYVLHEDGINAFAAGYGVNDAVVGVTQGAIDHLSRDELQGVIAHEFSHILNGDMKINLRLVGILYGILMLSMIGRIVLRGSSRRSRSSKGGGAVVAVGLGLLVIGYAGVFFGNLIKAAVSRQREFLADASAVQFTRNPGGIAGALKRIGGYEPAASIENPNAEEIGHALFASSLKKAWFSLAATHPPLADRIQRIEPGWDGEFQFQDEEDGIPDDKSSMDEGVKGFAGGSAKTMDTAIEQIGVLKPESILQARDLIGQLPAAMSLAVHEPHGARAVIYLLLLNRNAEIRQQQLAHLQEEADASVVRELLKLLRHDMEMTPRMRLPLLEMSIPALRQLTDAQFGVFKNNIDVLVRADGRMDIFEWSLQKIMMNALEASRAPRRKGAKYGSFTRLVEHCSVIISMLVYCDNKPPETYDHLIKIASEKLKCQGGLRLYEKSELDLKKLDQAVDELRRLKPLLKPRLLKACAAVITSDNQITPSEAELMRAIADTLDCPMPPLLGNTL